MGELGLKVLRVTSPEAMALPQMQSLFGHAFEIDSLGDAEEVRAWLAPLASEPTVGIFVVMDDGGDLLGLAITAVLDGPLSPPASILHFYSGVPQGVRSLLVEAVVGWMRSVGVKTIWAINQTGRSDEVHMRAFRSFATGTPRGSVIEYEIDA